MKFSAYIAIEVRSLQTGKLLHRKRRFKSDSYVRAFIDLHYRHRTSTAWVVMDITGTPRSLSPHVQDWRMDSGAYDPNGIQAGTGTTAVNINDYSLETRIADGSGAGELVYQNTQFVAPVTIGTRRRFFMTRTLLNQSGGAITINEVGIYTWGQTAGQGYCIVRDTVVPGEVVPDLSSITVQYEIFAEA